MFWHSTEIVKGFFISTLLLNMKFLKKDSTSWLWLVSSYYLKNNADQII
jgi:hypothetical protein